MLIKSNVDVDVDGEDGGDDTYSYSYVVESEWHTDELSRIVFHDNTIATLLYFMIATL